MIKIRQKVLAIVLLVYFPVFVGFGAEQLVAVNNSRQPQQRGIAVRGIPASDHIIKGVVRVKLNSDGQLAVQKAMGKRMVLSTRSASTSLKTGISSLDKKLLTYKASTMKRVFPYHPKYETRQREMGLHLWYQIEIDEKQSVLDVCKELGVDPAVVTAEPVLKTAALQVNTKQTIGGKALGPVRGDVSGVINIPFLQPLKTINEGVTTARSRHIPIAQSEEYEKNPPTNDPRLLEQWHYYNYGQFTAERYGRITPGADIKLFDAWKINMGSKDVIVSIHDQGIDFNHPDLKNNMWVNKAELNGKEGVDDDGNGYIDDIHGYNFIKNMSGIKVGSHGTHVAGTVSAENNNGIGVAGVAGGSGKGDGVRLMCCQILVPEGAVADLPASYVYAANNGAVISQNSWGWTDPDVYEEAVFDGIDYFIKYAGKDENGNPLPGTRMNGGIVIFAAGNDGVDLNRNHYYPCYYPSCFVVAATGPQNEQMSYTNFGKRIDISAPGGNTYVGQPTGVLSTFPDGNYSNLHGTSMACPHVSGVAALILSQFGNKGYTPEMLRNRLLTGVTPWSKINAAYEGTMGAGLLNAAVALEPDDQIAPDSITDVTAKYVGYDFLAVEFTAPEDKDNGNAISYELAFSEKMLTEENFTKASLVYKKAQEPGATEEIVVNGLKGETTYYVAVRSYDMWGNISHLSNILTIKTKIAPSIQLPTDTIQLWMTTASTQPIVSESFKIGNKAGGDLHFELDYAFTDEPNALKTVYRTRCSNINTSANRYEGLFGSDGSERFLAASQFTVKSERFTLTNVVSPIYSRGVYPLGVDYIKDTIVLKIYKGGDVPTKGQQVVNSSFVVPFKTFILASLYGFMPDINFGLTTPTRFVKGDKFWVVFDFKKGFYQPMGIQVKTNTPTSGELFSTDNETWTPLSSVQVGDLQPNYAFRIYADDRLSMLPANAIELTPLTGYVTSGAENSVCIKANAEKLVEGRYTGIVHVRNNTPGKTYLVVPFRLDVNGHRAGIASEKVISLKSTVQGYTDSTKLVVRNDSLGGLEISRIESTDPQFTVKPNQNIRVKSGDSTTIMVYFTAPTTAGAHTARLNFKTNVEGVDYSVIAEAVAVDPPMLDMPKTSESVTLGLKEDKTIEFTVTNKGKSRLEYSVGKDLVNDFDFSDVEYGVHQYYGKKYGLNNGFWKDKREKFVSIENTPDAVDITRQITGSSLYHIDLPFVFSSYDVDYRALTVTGDGRIMFGKQDVYQQCSGRLGRTANKATIFPLNFQNSFMVTNLGGRAWMKKANDHIIFEYTKMGLTYGDGITSSSVRTQVRLDVDGTITLSYTDHKAPEGGGAGLTDLAALIGISDTTGVGGLGIWEVSELSPNPRYKSLNEKSINGYGYGVLIWETINGVYQEDTLSWTNVPGILDYDSTMKVVVKPNQTFVKDIVNGNGSLLPGETATVKLTVRVDKQMAEGMIKKVLSVYTNDPLRKEVPFELNLNYQAEALPEVDKNVVDMGNVGKGITRKMSVILNNRGGKTFKVTARMKSGVFVKVAPTERDLLCRALSSLSYQIEFTPTEEVDYQDYLIFEFDEAETGMKEMQVSVVGKGAKTPKVKVIKASDDIYFTVDKRKNQRYFDTTLIVKNTGDEVLKYNLLLPGWLKEMSIAAKSGFDQFGYYWTDNMIDTSGVSYDWIENHPDTVKELNPVIDDKLFPSAPLDLPFEFDFYGEKFKTIRVDRSATITFKVLDCHYRLDGNIKGAGNLQFPVKDVANGIIGGLLGAYGPTLCTYEAVGKGGDMKFVVTFNVGPGKLQTILYKDGRIKFQYKDIQRADQGFLKEWLNNITIGIENRTGTDGFMISYNNPESVQNYRAIMITPCKQRTLAPGEQHSIRLRADMTESWDGKYIGNVLVVSNDEGHRIDTTRFYANVIGQSKLEYYVDGKQTKMIDFGKVDRTCYPISHGQGRFGLEFKQDFGLVTKDVTIKNAGTRKVVLFKREQKSFVRNQLFDTTFMYPMRGNLPENVYLEPNQSIVVPLGFYTGLKAPQFGQEDLIKLGKNEVHFWVRDKIFDADKATEQGFTLEDAENNPGWGSPENPYFYQEDTLVFKYELVDVPTESISCDEKIIERSYEERSGEETVSFDIVNTQKPEDYWNKLFNRDANKYDVRSPKIEAQGVLDYEVVLEELSEQAYDQLRNPKKGAVEKAALRKRFAKPQALTSGIMNATSATSQVAVTKAKVTHLDSLGHFGFYGLVAGYFPPEVNLKFKNYTRMKTSKEGFNITHLRAYMGKLANAPQVGYDVEVRISIGKELLESQEIYSEIFTPNIQKFGDFNYVDFDLGRDVYIYPDTYVWITYVNGCNTCVACVWWLQKEYTLEMEYSFWGDNGKEAGTVAQLTNTYGGWDVAAFSDRKKEKVEPWCHFSTTKGSLEAGKSETVQFTFSPAKDASEMPIRYAKISLKSNDHYPFGVDTTMRSDSKFKRWDGGTSKFSFAECATTREKNVILVKLSVNQGPKVYTTSEFYNFKETVDSTIVVKVLDKEKDAIQKVEFRIESSVGFDSIYGVLPEIKYGEPTQLTNDTLAYPVTFVPNYESSGSYKYNVVATDAKGKEGVFKLNVNVLNTNRKPIVTGDIMNAISKDEQKRVNLSEMFIDPDRQSLTYTAESLNNDLVVATVEDSVMTLNGWKEGEGFIKITAIDPEDAFVSVKYKVTVAKEKLAASLTEVTLFPNPTVHELQCRFALNKRADVSFKVYDMEGKLCMDIPKMVFTTGEHTHLLNVSTLASGTTYILHYLVNGDVKNVKQFIKVN